jgi:hypothetical protein
MTARIASPLSLLVRAFLLIFFFAAAATAGAAMSTTEPTSSTVQITSLDGEEEEGEGDGRTQCYWLFDRLVCPVH